MNPSHMLAYTSDIGITDVNVRCGFDPSRYEKCVLMLDIIMDSDVDIRTLLISE